MIQFNSQNIFKEIHYDSHDIKYVYGGCSGDLVWEKGTPPVPPVFDGKFKLTLNDSSVVTAACDSTSSVTRNEISRPYSATVVYAEIGDCVTGIGPIAFSGCTSLTSCTIGNAVTSIGNFAFSECSSLTSIDIPNSVTSIDKYAFDKCTSLTNCTIGNGVTSIGQYAFIYCSTLISVTIGTGATSIQSGAFWQCSGLTSVTVNAVTPPSLGNNVFDNTNNCPIYVPAESVDAYKTASDWSTYASRIQVIP